MDPNQPQRPGGTAEGLPQEIGAGSPVGEGAGSPVAEGGGSPVASPQVDRPVPPDLPPAPPWAPAPPPPPPPSSFGRGPGPAPGLEYATFGSRLIAYVIDSVIVGVVTGIVSAVMGGGLLGMFWFGGFGFGGPFSGAPFRFDFGLARIAFAVIAGLISGAYFVWFWTRTGATPGQSFLGLEVRNAADGGLLTQDQAVRRWAFLVVPFISVFPPLGLLVFLYQLYLAYTVTTDPNRQGFHDHQAGTVVTRRVA